MLQAHIQGRGTGDVVPVIEGHPVIRGDAGEPMALSHRREHERHVQTIFGTVERWRLTGEPVNRHGGGEPPGIWPSRPFLDPTWTENR